MLTCLRVRQLAIIDELEVELGPGLNVVTGETGAGKSILVNAMKLLLGERGRPELVRGGAERAEVEALFDLSALPAARQRLEQLEVDVESELVVRRTVDLSGRSRAFLNGRLTPLNQLSAVMRGLVDICSQHEHHSLVESSNHLGYLDAFARLETERQMNQGDAGAQIDLGTLP
jgi:DNA repair protein RecN (Recombination protein N)